MIPEQRLSTTNVLTAMTGPREARRGALVDVELGGVALNDPTQGLQVATWDAYYSGDIVYVKSDEVAPTPVPVMTRAGLMSLSLTFDQNMQPAIGWETATEAGLYWFDTTIPAYTDVILPAGSRNPRCTLDDKRPIPNTLGESDIILAYLRGADLYFRAQRDRFLVEYLLGTGFAENYLEQIGMGRGLRLMFRLQGVQV